MKNTFSQIVKVLFLYITGWILLYPIYIVVGFITQNNIFWMPLICLLVASEGFLIWKLTHCKNMSARKNTLNNTKTTCLKNWGIQFITVLVLLILIVVKESRQMFYSLIPYYKFLEKILGNRKWATILSFGNVPIINVGNFLIVSIGWGSYNITQLLFDRRIQNTIQ